VGGKDVKAENYLPMSPPAGSSLKASRARGNLCLPIPSGMCYTRDEVSPSWQLQTIFGSNSNCHGCPWPNGSKFFHNKKNKGLFRYYTWFCCD
jgi:hypothetical protein